MWCVAELALEHRRVDAGFTYGVVDSAAYRQMNPNGTVPTLQDSNGVIVWETGAILRYLGASYGSDSFWPSDPVSRATVDQWAEWAKINVAGKFTNPIFWVANNQYLAGEDFTIADIQIGHCLYRYFSIDIPRVPYAHIERYYAMLCRREAYQLHVQVDYSELIDSM